MDRGVIWKKINVNKILFVISSGFSFFSFQTAFIFSVNLHL